MVSINIPLWKIDAFITLVKKTTKEYKLHRSVDNEIVYVDKHGATYHIFDDRLYVVRYPKPSDLPYEFIRQLIQDFLKSGSTTNIINLCEFWDREDKEKDSMGFEYYGDLWELGAEITDEDGILADTKAKYFDMTEVHSVQEMENLFNMIYE